MIPFDFEYYKPDSKEEAVKVFEELSAQGKQPIYYSGGTEIITGARRKLVFTKAVIDIKGIPECNIFELCGDELIIGGSVSLTQVSEAKGFPLFSQNSSFPANHTARNKITLCGNICGKIPYREAILSHLVADSKVVIVGTKGVRILPINQVFNEKLQLEKGEIILQIKVKKSYGKLPYFAVKKIKQGVDGYPLVSMAALKKDNKIRVAISGVCAFPFRSQTMETNLNNENLSLKQRVNEAVNHLPAPIVSNVQGSAQYKKFVLKNTLFDALVILEGEKE
jgi:CO/xanthine dehydrogenase FAD-binding subunit